jgi:hypothetical protein
MYFALTCESLLLSSSACSTWNKFGCSHISAHVLEETANALVELGLNKAGYEFVNADVSAHI